MPNNNIQKSVSKSVLSQKPNLNVIILKLVILFIILAVPITLMLADLSKNLAVYKNMAVYNQKGGNLNQGVGDEFNVQIPVPASKMGDISNVPPEKIKSLFSNLKQ